MRGSLLRSFTCRPHRTESQCVNHFPRPRSILSRHCFKASSTMKDTDRPVRFFSESSQSFMPSETVWSSLTRFQTLLPSKTPVNTGFLRPSIYSDMVLYQRGVFSSIPRLFPCFLCWTSTNQKTQKGRSDFDAFMRLVRPVLSKSNTH